MSNTHQEKVDWKKFINENHDCPEAIYRLADTEWQKQVALEFLSNQEDRNIMKTRLALMEKLSWATFTVVAIAAVGQIISTFVLPLL